MISRSPGRPRHFPSLGWAALGVLAFSFTFPATVVAERSFDPLLVGAGRSILAAAIAAISLRVAGVGRPGREDWPGLILVALGCGIGFGALSALALRHTTSSHAAIVVGLLPALTATVAVLRGGERPGLVFWLASLTGTIVVGAYALSRGAGTLRPADLLLLCSAIVAAVGYAEGGRLARGMPGWQVIAWALVVALPLSLPLTVEALLRHPPAHFGLAATAGFLYVGTISTFVGFFAWYRGLAEAGVARASQLQLAQPLLTIAWSIPLLGDHIDAAGLLVAGVVGVCVVVTQRTRVPPQAEGAASDRPPLRRRCTP